MTILVIVFHSPVVYSIDGHGTAQEPGSYAQIATASGLLVPLAIASGLGHINSLPITDIFKDYILLS